MELWKLPCIRARDRLFQEAPIPAMRHMPADTDQPLNAQAQEIGSLPPVGPAPDGAEQDTGDVTLRRAGANRIVRPQGCDPSGGQPLRREKPAHEFAGFAQRDEAPEGQDAHLDIVEAAEQIVEPDGSVEDGAACDVDPYAAVPVRQRNLLLSIAGENHRRDVGKRREVERVAIRA